ncbi:protein MIGRI [Chromobacterium sp. CV08]|uniref:protein MIGRI n=1 Tax=Chromobacterium sp. CV08 TaxID=3133274 RepID=UPI003DA8D66F
MFGRLFKFFVLCLLLWAAARWLFGPGQRRALRELVSTLAIALLLSAGVFCILYWLGWHQL